MPEPVPQFTPVLLACAPSTSVFFPPTGAESQIKAYIEMTQTHPMSTPQVEVPTSVEAALDPDWLSDALKEVSGGARVIEVEVAELIRTTATKIRVRLRFDNEPQRTYAYCIKSMFDPDGKSGGSTDVREASFYRDIAPRITTSSPGVPAAAIDPDGIRAVLIMDDMIEEGVRFCSALQPFSADEAALSIEQIARLHAGASLLDEFSWIPYRAATFIDYFSPDLIRTLSSDGRAQALRPDTFEPERLFAGMRALRSRTENEPMTMLHGDCHAGNFYRSADGFGVTDWQLIQRGAWAQDVAYHIVAVLPIEIAEKEERALLDHYLDAVVRFGGIAPDRERAWEDYRAAQIYGLFLWAITRSGGPELIRTFVERLGAGAERHNTMKLLGV